MTEDDYKESFGMGKTPDPGKTKTALDYALDIRKFEIGLYWQRAAYFWALIAVAFAGYFAVLSAEHLSDKEYLAYVISCIGLLFTWAWYLVNRGSKLWQENWENHVDKLEDGIVGPLYKTVLVRPKSVESWVERLLTGPKAFSVSKVNLWVSIFTLVIWVCLVRHSLPRVTCSDIGVVWRYVGVAVLTLFFGGCMWFGGKSDLSKGQERMLNVMDRKVTIAEK